MSYGSRPVDPQAQVGRLLALAGYEAVPSTGLRVLADGATESDPPRVLGYVCGPEVGCARFFHHGTGEVAEVSANLVWRWHWASTTKGRASPVTVQSFLANPPTPPPNG